MDFGDGTPLFAIALMSGILPIVLRFLMLKSGPRRITLDLTPFK
jgi:hypothetical protein